MVQGVYEIVVGQEAASLRRDPLQRVRDQSVPMGEAQGWSNEACSGRSLDTPALCSACLSAHNEFLHPGSIMLYAVLDGIAYNKVYHGNCKAFITTRVCEFVIGTNQA
jgi:hypothetical protein